MSPRKIIVRSRPCLLAQVWLGVDSAILSETLALVTAANGGAAAQDRDLDGGGGCDDDARHSAKSRRAEADASSSRAWLAVESKVLFDDAAQSWLVRVRVSGVGGS